LVGGATASPRGPGAAESGAVTTDACVLHPMPQTSTATKMLFDMRGP
jgi:hypothetical protein